MLQYAALSGSRYIMLLVIIVFFIVEVIAMIMVICAACAEALGSHLIKL